MPTAPRYSEPQVKESGFPGGQTRPSATVEAFGGGQASARTFEATRDLVNTGQKLFVEEKNNADQLKVLEADEKASALETSTQYDPKTGAMNKKGKDAFGLITDVKSSWDKGIEEIGKELTNDNQRVAFKRRVNARWSSVNSNIQRHVSGEIKSYDNALTESYLANERNAATVNYMDKNRIGIAIENQQVEIYKHAQRNGLPEEWAKLKIEDATSKTHVSIISRMLTNEQDVAAKNYFSENRTLISGDDIEKVEKALEEGTLRGESQRRADEIIQKEKGRAEALSQAKQIEDPKLRDATETRINQEFNQRKAIQAEEQNDLYLQATNILDSSQGVSDPREVISPAMWTKLDLSQRNALENRIGDHPNDDKKWLDFLALSTDQVAGLNRSDFESKYWANFDKVHRSRAETQWNASREAVGKKETDPKITASLTFKDRVDNTLRTNGLIRSNKMTSEFSGDEARLYAQFEGAAAKQLEDYEVNELQGKRKAGGTEIQKILDEMVIKKVFIEKAWWKSDPQVPSALVIGDDRRGAYVPFDNIPDNDRSSIERYIRARGKNITKEKMERAYAAYLIDDKKLFNGILGE